MSAWEIYFTGELIVVVGREREIVPHDRPKKDPCGVKHFGVFVLVCRWDQRPAVEHM